MVDSGRWEAQRRWRERNPEKVKEWRRQRWLRDKEGSIAQVKAWRKANPEREKASRDARYAKDPQRYIKAVIDWQKKHGYQRKRYATDVNHRIRMVMSTRMNKALKAAGGSKRGESWKAHVGYTVDELRAHIERQFKRWMTWENFGEWHIDHVRPCSSFDLSNEEQLRECFALSNLRPLRATENLRKQATFTHLL